MNDPEMKLDAGDVSTQLIPLLKCDECEEYQATHRVFVDFRNAGIKNQIGGNLCEACADELVLKIRGGL